MNREEALKLAMQMDQQEQAGADLDQEEQIDRFLKATGQIESSGGKDFSHRLITSGPHKGHRAAGTYGFMPNTMNEMLNRMATQQELTPEMKKLKALDFVRKKAMLESNPELEDQLARFMAKHVLDRQMGDEEKATYAWEYGHNLSPKTIEARNYKESDRVKKYQRLLKELGDNNG